MSELIIAIRRAEPTDAQDVYEIYSNPRAVWGTFQLPYPSLEEWKKRLGQPPEGAYLLVAQVEDAVVGMLGLHTFTGRPRRRHAAEIGMGVHDAWQGRGVGGALMQAAVDLADNWLNLRRLELQVFVDNEPAIRLYARFGFKVEGTLIDYGFRDGAYIDAFSMARLRPDIPARSTA